MFAGKTVSDVNVRTSLNLSYLYSTTAVYVASLERVAAPSWLKINYRCYFCPSVSMSVLLSGVSLPISLSSLIISFLCFIPLSSLTFLPYLSLAPLISFIALHLDSAALAAAATPVRLQCLTLARGAFFCGKPMCNTLHVEFRRR